MPHSQVLDLNEVLHLLKAVQRCHLPTSSVTTIPFKISLGPGTLVSPTLVSQQLADFCQDIILSALGVCAKH